ncbi:division/cell wall cluster transcriptional repressor MraZ [Asticcacaulis sp. YBE204]|uniref:division/cell wall cluster transcriptional repressor MraZ n=1 Tax=Asticcacaulis sp. YBE204 TaxID=1282363 RepID=UPI0003C40B86|nr:cell division protein MraZ [Asticcacaulis sp. YBE204]ESQ79801.1 cell division protein MraZ [Asticcacaulis sp. YBE204]
MFLSTHEKQLDAKRRLLVPQDFRAAALVPFEGIDSFDGVYCFAMKTLGCLECGGAEFFSHYKTLIDAQPFGSAARRGLEARIYSGMSRLSFDTAGRVTLPDALCEQFNIREAVLLTGLYDRFQIWNPDAYAAHLAQQDGDLSGLFAELGL